MVELFITGASGFLGKSLVPYFASRSGYSVRAIYRSTQSIAKVENCQNISVSDIVTDDFAEMLVGVDCVIHSAARAHVMNESLDNAVSAFRRVNVQGTLNVANAAVEAGVRRFIYISSIKVLGEETFDAPFNADSIPAPCDPYGVSKFEAEEALLGIARKAGMEVVIIRPPLMYGPGVKANFLALMKCLRWRLPLPLKAINNKRSLVSVDNLLDFISVCVEHPAAAGQAFLVSDGEDLSTPQLLSRLGRAMGKPATLYSVPESIIVAGANLLGRPAIARRLCGSLQVDIDKSRRLLGWTPPYNVDDSLSKVVRDFL